MGSHRHSILLVAYQLSTTALLICDFSLEADRILSSQKLIPVSWMPTDLINSGFRICFKKTTTTTTTVSGLARVSAEFCIEL
jgi:hypothetical protein